MAEHANDNDRYIREDALRIASTNKDIKGLKKRAAEIVDFLKGDMGDNSSNRESIAGSNVNPDDKVVPLT